jgi:glycosyltransferase involved in cell wall biosynthesis
MNVLFMGFLYDESIENELIVNSKHGLQGAANSFQWGLVEGLEQCLHKAVDLCTTLPVGTYPRHYKKLLIQGGKWNHRGGASDLEIGYVNLPLLKQYLRFNESINYIEKWLANHQCDNNVVILYSLYSPFLKAIEVIKKKYKESIYICLVVPDLPLHYGIQSSLISVRGIIERFDGYKKLNMLNCVDSFVLLTEQMKEPLKIGSKPYVVIEGIARSEVRCLRDNHEDLKKSVLYTGTLNYEFGIANLLKAFEQIEGNYYELWICGSGEAEKEIIAMSKVDQRIKYFGYVSKKEIYELQQQATLLINPRTNEGEYTKYSFPSKTMEYMLSGKPVLMYKLDGIPDEYDQYLYYINGSEPKDIADRIMEICKQPQSELDDFGQKARKFVLENKNSEVQAKKIIDMLNEDINIGK